MKRVFALLLAMILVLSMTACGQEETVPEVEGSYDITGVDLSTFTFGVTEDGDDVVVTVKNDTEIGEIVCVTTYRYEEDKLVKAVTEYYVPEENVVQMLADELAKDSLLVLDSVKADGTCVSCQLADSALEELQKLSREELIQTMEYAISNTREQAAE